MSGGRQHYASTLAERPDITRSAGGSALDNPHHRRARNREHDSRRRQSDRCRPLYGTARWQRISAAQREAEPLCRMCLARGLTVAATVCDHIVPHRGDEAMFWSGPFQSLCKPCHDADKQRIESGGRPRLIFDPDGNIVW